MGAHSVTIAISNGVNTDHHTLAAKGQHQFIYQVRPLQRWCVDRNFVSALFQHARRITDAANSTGDGKTRV